MARLLLAVLVSYVLMSESAWSNAKVNTDCSAALFTMPGRPDNSPALILTAGHCIGLGSYGPGPYPNDGEYFVNVPLNDTHALRSATIFRKSGKPTSVRIRKIIFATMTGLDVAVLELSATYRVLRGKGYKAFGLASTDPKPGDTLHIKSYNRRFDEKCAVDALVPELIEGPWKWRNITRARKCEVFEGVSGTAATSVDRNDIVGVAFTANTGGGTNCEIMSPCEKQSAADAPEPAAAGNAYISPTNALHGCYDRGKHRFDLKLDSCSLLTQAGPVYLISETPRAKK